MAPSADQPALVIPGGFTVLSLRFSEDDSHAALHQLCVKEHRVRAQTDRWTEHFVLNVPPYCSESVLTDVFSRFGPVQSVELKEKPGASESSDSAASRYFTAKHRQCFRVAYIVFKNASSVNATKHHPASIPLIISSADRPVRTSIHKWIQQYTDSLINASSLQQDIDQFMNDYDRQKDEEAERQKQEAEQQQEDEEGWVKVTKASRGVKVRPHSEKANERTLQKEKRKKDRKELLNFYTWQHGNMQKEHIAELRKKFEEDKQRIAVLRAQRKFRPY